MRLTVLGSAASYPDAGRACAGHLLSRDGTTVLLDCGNGVISNLGRLMDPTHLAAVFITHGHVDHFADVYALQAALRYAPDGPAAPLPLYVPPGVFDLISSALTEHGARELTEAFEVHDLVEGTPIGVGPITVTPRSVDHVPPTFALVAESGGARLCYTSDTRPGAAAEAAAAGAGVLLADATLPPKYAGRAPHMTAAEAGALARSARAHTLVLTHLWPTVDRIAAVEQAREVFGGRVMVAEEMDSFEVT